MYIAWLYVKTDYHAGVLQQLQREEQEGRPRKSAHKQHEDHTAALKEAQEVLHSFLN